MLVNGVLMSCESWPKLSEQQLKSMEDCDIKYFSNIFNCSGHTNRVLYYIETAKLPLRFVMAKKRLMFLHHILTRESSELIRKVYELQTVRSTKGDLSKARFKKMVNRQVNKYAYQWLLNIA